MGAGVGVTHNDRETRPDKAFFRENRMADAVATDIKEVFDVLTVCPVTQGLALFCRLGVFCRCHVVDDCLDAGAVKNTVFATGDQVVDRNRCGDLVTEHTIQFQYGNARCRCIDPVRIKDFLCSCFTHFRIFLSSCFFYNISYFTTFYKQKHLHFEKSNLYLTLRPNLKEK